MRGLTGPLISVADAPQELAAKAVPMRVERIGAGA